MIRFPQMDARAYVPGYESLDSSTQHVPSAMEWLTWRGEIERLYVTERRSLKDVIATMANEHGFKAT